MKRAMWAGTLGLLAGALGFGEPLTLEQAVAAALTKGPDRVRIEADGRASQALYGGTVAAAWPSLTLTGGVTDEGTDSLDTAVRTVEAGAVLGIGSSSWSVEAGKTSDDERTVSVSLTQNLWDGYIGGQSWGTAYQASLNQKSAALSSQAELQDLVVTIKKAFYTLLSAQESLPGLVSARDQAALSLSLVQARSDAGQASPLDLQAAKITARTAEINARTGQTTLAQARRALAALTGLDDGAEMSAAAAMEKVPTPASVTEAVAYALAHRTEKAIAELTLQAARVGLNLAWADLNPTVDLKAEAVRTLKADASSDAFSVGIDVSWAVWDSGVGGQAVRRQEALVQSAEAALTKQERTIRQEVEAAWEDWTIQGESLELAQMTLENAQAALAVAQAQFQAGTVTNSDLLDAQTTAMTAQADLTTATINLRLSVLTLKTALGYQE